MASRKQSNRERGGAAEREPAPKRQASPRVLIAAGVVLALLVAGLVLAVAVTGGSSGEEDASSTANVATLPQGGEVAKLLAGIPQNGNVLGRPSAPVTLREYADLQCPYCRGFDIESMEQLIGRYVRTGQLKIDLRLIATLGPDSQRGRGAVLAAAKQDKMFQLAKLLYLHQGAENSGWLTDDLIASAAASIPGLDGDWVIEQRVAPDIATQAQEMDADATADAVQVTPTIIVGKSGERGQQVELSSPADYRSVADAIDNALSS